MKKLRKILCLFLSMLMILSINVPAFAVNSADRTVSANEETHNNEKPLSIAISTNKENYKTLGVAKITATITNTSDEDIQNVSAEAVFTDLAPVGKKTDIKKEVETLKSGESISFAYKATLNKSEHKLNILQKIFLWLVRLFNGGFTASDNGFDNGREYVALTNSLTFGDFSADNEVRVWYGENGKGSTSKEYEELIKGVDIEEEYDKNIADIVYDNQTGIEYVSNIIILMFDYDCTDEEKAKAITSINGTVVGGREDVLYIEIEKTTLTELQEICDKLTSTYRLDAFYDEVFTSDALFDSNIPNDTYLIDNSSEIASMNNNWDLTWSENDIQNTVYRNWYHLAIKTVGAWRYNSYFHNISIGVVDNGFSENHEDLNINIISNKNDVANHGTHVAGIIGATANNGKGSAGIVWNKKLYGYSIGTGQLDITKARFFRTSFYSGLEKNIKNGCKVINFSQGFSGYLKNCNRVFLDTTVNMWGKEASKEIAKWLKKGYDFIVVQSAGNGANDSLGVDTVQNGLFCSITKDNCYSDKYVTSDDIIQRVITVANTTIDGGSRYVLTEDSNGGTANIAAPGELIYSTVAGVKEVDNLIEENQQYAKMSGTSMAAPIVAGVASLVWSVNPNFSGVKVRKIVLDTATKGVVKDNPTSPTAGDFDLVNAKNAVEEAIRQTYKTCTVSGNIVELGVNTPLADVDITVTNKEDNKTITGTSDENGKFSFILPVGEYKIKFEKMEYSAITVETEDKSKPNQFLDLGEITMIKEKGNVFGTVKDNETNNPIANVTVEVVDNKSENLDPITTTTTDESGSFSLHLEYGNYSLSFHHDNYEYKGISCIVDSDNIVYLNAILLTRKNSFGGEDVSFAGGDGTEKNPYQIETPEQLNAIRYHLDKYFIQKSNIDLSKWGCWKPIGTANFPFTGSFDGNDFEIKNLLMEGEDYPDSSVGMFGYAPNSTLKNIHLISCTIKPEIICDYLGGIVGYGGYIDNCSASGVIDANSYFAGGIAGYAFKASNCSYKGTLNFYSYNKLDIPAPLQLIITQSDISGYFGGICGICNSAEKCANLSTVNSYGEYVSFLGGIAGYGYAVSQSYNKGALYLYTNGNERKNPEAYLGGITGVSKRVADSFNAGNLQVASSYSGMVGGITGLGYGTYQSCYNIGNLTNSARYSYYKGGIIGLSHITTSRISYCYSNIAKLAGTGNVSSKVEISNSTNLSMTEFLEKSSYTGFDFDKTWNIDSNINSGYPYLNNVDIIET